MCTPRSIADVGALLASPVSGILSTEGFKSRVFPLSPGISNAHNRRGSTRAARADAHCGARVRLPRRYHVHGRAQRRSAAPLLEYPPRCECLPLTGIFIR